MKYGLASEDKRRAHYLDEAKPSQASKNTRSSSRSLQRFVRPLQSRQRASSFDYVKFSIIEVMQNR